MSGLRLLVKQLRYEADGVVSVALEDASGAELPAWDPGSHIDLVLPSGVVRQYSLCGDPADCRVYRIGVLREPESRGGSRWIHNELRVGSVLNASQPRNHFRFDSAPELRFIAGGIGITPLLPMIQEAQSKNLSWQLTYGGKSRAAMAFIEELPEGDVLMRPQDEVGLLDLDEAAGSYEDGKRVYACGPAPLLTALEEHCQDWPEGALRLERFAAPAVPVVAGVGEYVGDIEVRAERSGIETKVPEGESIMDCLEEAGVDTPFSCREGICGTCETKVLEGVPAHRDYVLTNEEKAAGQTMMICVSRARTSCLVLDI